MKFLAITALAGATQANTHSGIQMLQVLQSMEEQNMMDTNTQHLQQVKEALVKCAAAGDCSQEAAKMPNLYSMTTLTAQETYVKCLDDNKGKSQSKIDENCGADAIKAKEADEAAYLEAKYNSCIENLGTKPDDSASDDAKDHYKAE